MPQLQVLGREEDFSDTGAQDAQAMMVKQQEMMQDLMYKSATLKYQSQMLKVSARNAENDSEKMRMDKQASQFLMFSKLLEGAQQFKTQGPGGTETLNTPMFLKFAMTALRNNPEMLEVFKDPQTQKMLESMQPSPETQKTQADTRKASSIAAFNEIMAPKIAGEGAQNGQGGGKGWVVSKFDPNTGPEFTNLDAIAQQKQMEAGITEQSKPYNETEAGIVSKAELIPPAIDEMIAMLDKPGNAYGFMPWGANRIASFGDVGKINDFSKSLTAGTGRKLGLELQKIKVLAFGEGGKNLTENEKAVVYAYLNPVGKTEAQWKRDLQYAKDLLIRKAELLSKPRGQTQPMQGNKDQQAISALMANGMSQEEALSALQNYKKSRVVGGGM